MKKKNADQFYDPFLRRKQDYKPIPGLSFVDQARMSPGPSIPLSVELGGSDARQRSIPRDQDELLCAGACCGIDRNGIVRHLQPGLVGFVGFAAGNEEGNLVCVRYRFRAFLQVPDATVADRGKEVFATGPAGPFTIQRTSGAYRVGFMRFKEPDSDRCSVAVVSYDDDCPRDLKIVHNQ